MGSLSLYFTIATGFLYLTIALQEEEGEGIHCSNQTPLPQWDPGEKEKEGGGQASSATN